MWRFETEYQELENDGFRSGWKLKMCSKFEDLELKIKYFNMMVTALKEDNAIAVLEEDNAAAVTLM